MFIRFSSAELVKNPRSERRLERVENGIEGIEGRFQIQCMSIFVEKDVLSILCKNVKRACITSCITCIGNEYVAKPCFGDL